MFEDLEFPPTSVSIDGRAVSKTASNHTRSLIKCSCGLETAAKVVYKDGPNHGRHFRTCKLNICKFFLWVDGSSNSIVQNIEWKRFNLTDGWLMVNNKTGFLPSHILLVTFIFILLAYFSSQVYLLFYIDKDPLAIVGFFRHWFCKVK